MAFTLEDSGGAKNQRLTSRFSDVDGAAHRMIREYLTMSDFTSC